MPEEEEKKVKLRHTLADVVVVSPEFVVINQLKYRVLKNYRNALDIDLLRQKFDPFLDKYDYLVGDVSSDKLRLKGFFKGTSNKINLDKKVDTIEDYIYEYLNPGVAYFVLESLTPKKIKVPAKNKKNFRERPVKKTNLTGKVAEKSPRRKRHSFVIKKRNESEA